MNMGDDQTRLSRKIQKLLVGLFVIVVAVFAIWAPFFNEVSPPSSGTATLIPFTPEADFAVNIPQKALLKNYLVVSVEAASGTNCRLIFVPPSGDTQIMYTEADDAGLCTWRWKLAESVGKGDGRLIFTINGISDTHFIEIRSSF